MFEHTALFPHPTWVQADVWMPCPLPADFICFVQGFAASVMNYSLSAWGFYAFHVQKSWEGWSSPFLCTWHLSGAAQELLQHFCTTLVPVQEPAQVTLQMERLLWSLYRCSLNYAALKGKAKPSSPWITENRSGGNSWIFQSDCLLSQATI